MVELREMREADLHLVDGWLGQQHVARWYLQGTTREQELRDCKGSLDGAHPTHLYIVELERRPIGWCQWYRCDDYPDHATAVGAAVGDVGIDYAIGEPDEIGLGRGTELVAALVSLVRSTDRTAGVIADPDAANVASRRVLEKNGFELLGERPVPSEAVSAPVAIYRLATLTNRSVPEVPAGRDSN
jgi:aminoglycoside 6'-N-acetyltransferase